MSVEQLTEREILIAQGKDPDNVQESPPEEKDPEADNEAEGSEEQETSTKASEGGEEEAEGKDAKDKAKDGAASKSKKAAPAVKAEEEAEEEEEEEEEEAPAPRAKKAKKAKAQSQEEEEIDLDPEKYAKEGYDEETINLVKYTKKIKEELAEVKETVQQVREIEAARQHQRQLDEFHDALDSLPEEIVGRSLDDEGNPVKLTGKAGEARKAVWERATELYNSEVKSAIKAAKKSGEDPVIPDLKKITRTAAELVFAKELRDLDKEKLRKELEEQSRKRRPVSSGSTRRDYVPAGKSAQKEIDPAKAIANDPKIVKFWEKAQEENGHR